MSGSVEGGDDGIEVKNESGSTFVEVEGDVTGEDAGIEITEELILLPLRLISMTAPYDQVILTDR